MTEHIFAPGDRVSLYDQVGTIAGIETQVHGGEAMRMIVIYFDDDPIILSLVASEIDPATFRRL